DVSINPKVTPVVANESCFGQPAWPKLPLRRQVKLVIGLVLQVEIYRRNVLGNRGSREDRAVDKNARRQRKWCVEIKAWRKLRAGCGAELGNITGVAAAPVKGLIDGEGAGVRSISCIKQSVTAANHKIL